MSRLVRVASAVVLALTLSGCTAGASATTATPQPSGVVLPAEDGSDVGNDRPLVTYDGLMVRRRVVVAVHASPGADLGSLRTELGKAASRDHLTLFDISPDVLDPILLERQVPELTVVLPSGSSLAEARNLIDPANDRSLSFADVEEIHVASVLVHDLQFTASSANPAVLAESIAREGILSDALGNYATTLGSGGLDITYTGPLLSDDLVEVVRGGIARRANTQPSAVTVSPRSTTGVGVDMAKEPALAPAVTEISTAHNHSAGLPAVGGSSHPSNWAVSGFAVAVLLILTLVLLSRWRTAMAPP